MASSRALGLAERDSSVRSGGAKAATFVIKSDVTSNIIGEGRLGRVVTRAEVVVGGWRKDSFSHDRCSRCAGACERVVLDRLLCEKMRPGKKGELAVVRH